MAEISNADIRPNLDVDKLENEHTTLISIGIDESGSMDSYTGVMQDSIRSFKNSILGSKQADEILVSITRFNSVIQGSGFQEVDNISNGYSPSGQTALYDAVVTMQKNLINNGNGYLEQLQQNGIRTKGVAVWFSDGLDNASQSSVQDAKNAIDLLNRHEIICAFISFGGEATHVANQIGIRQENILDTNANESDLRRIFEILSKSAISSSQNTAQGTSQNTFFV